MQFISFSFKKTFNDGLKHRCIEKKKIKFIMTQTRACDAYTLLTRGFYARETIADSNVDINKLLMKRMCENAG